MEVLFTLAPVFSEKFKEWGSPRAKSLSKQNTKFLIFDMPLQ